MRAAQGGEHPLELSCGSVSSRWRTGSVIAITRRLPCFGVGDRAGVCVPLALAR